MKPLHKMFDRKTKGVFMSTKIKALLLSGLFSVVVVTTSACSTVAGAGKDIQKAGQVIEHEAKKI